MKALSASSSSSGWADNPTIPPLGFKTQEELVC